MRTMFFKSFAAARRSPAFFDARSSTYDLRFAEKECFLVVRMPVADLMLARNIAERGVHLNFSAFSSYRPRVDGLVSVGFGMGLLGNFLERALFSGSKRVCSKRLKGCALP